MFYYDINSRIYSDLSNIDFKEYIGSDKNGFFYLSNNYILCYFKALGGISKLNDTSQAHLIQNDLNLS